MQNTQITPFMFGETLVRTLTDSNGSFWFIAKDVCKVLGLDNVGQAISMLDEDEKSSIAPNIIRADVGMGASFKAGRLSTRTAIPEAGRGGRPLALITESGVYAFIFRSRKPQAKAFSKWVRSEVLPALRKTGQYAMPDMKKSPHTAHSDDILFSRAVTQHDTNTRVMLMEQAVRLAQKTPMSLHETERYFVRLCQMAGTSRNNDNKNRGIRRFINENLTSLPGKTLPFMRIYSAFYDWWELNEHGPVPGSKSLALALREYFEPQKSNTSHFRDCALRA